jgi:hypothetical protein
MASVQIHCYGCRATVAADPRTPEESLRAAGWLLIHGETYCPVCAPDHNPAAVQGGRPTVSADGPGGIGADPYAPEQAQVGAGQFTPARRDALPPAASMSTSVSSSAAPLREVALLDKLEGRARRTVAVGGLATGLGMLLFTGLSTTPAVVVVAACTVVGGPLSQLWDDRADRQTKQAMAILLGVMAFWLVAQPLSHHWGIAELGGTLRWVLLILGPVFIWRGLSSQRYLPEARASLGQPTHDVRLEIKILRGYGFIPYAQARLWPPDPAMLPTDGKVAQPLAQFSWQASEPALVALNAVPAKVHRAPTKGAVVVVSCPEAVLVARIKRSHFGESASPPRTMSPVMAWLWKPRSLRHPD